MVRRDEMNDDGYHRDRDRDDRDGGDDREGRSKNRSFHRKKVCKFCTDSAYVMDYKDGRLMSSYLMELGKIVPRRISGNCASHQRKLTTAIKRARIIGLVGFTSIGPDSR